MSGGVHFLVSGRWDNNVALVSLAHALDPANYGSSNAVVTRPRVTPDIEEHGATVAASGQPVSVAVSSAGDVAYVVNHSGGATPEAASAFQHGHPGTVTVLNLRKAFEDRSDGTLHAVEAIIPTDTTGPVGCALTPDQHYLAVTSAEAPRHEDGGYTITLIDTKRHEVAYQITQPLRRANAKPSPHAAPHETFGAFPNANGIAISPRHGGLLFTANGGTDDVSVIGLPAALDGKRDTEIARIAVEAGPFGIATSPDGRLLAVASRESARTGVEGRTISLIDVDRAVSGSSDAEIARTVVGTGRPDEQTRPFGIAFTPDGGRIVVTAFRSNTVSVIDVAQAVGGGGELARLSLSTQSGQPSRPRGVVVTPDGRYAAVVGAAKGAAKSSMLWIVSLDSLTVAGLVTAVGNESYFLDVVRTRPH